jgi:Ca2+-binding EF-hand superfamily protein
MYFFPSPTRSFLTSSPRVLVYVIKVFAWTWAATGWLLFFCGNYFDYKILQIAKAFAAPPADGANDANGGERDTLLDSSLPAWCRVDLENYMESRSFIPKWLSPHTTPTRQDTLFWSERKGPKMILLLFQIKLVFTAAYCALLILSFYPYMYHYESTVEFVAYLLVSLLPILIMGAESDESAANMSLISCIGVHRRPHSIAQVIREEKTDRIIRSLVILEKLQHAAEHGFQKPHPHDPHGSSSSSSHTIDKAEIADVSKTFDAFDLARDGYIEDSELKEIMEKVGAPVTKESLEAMLNLLDKDKNGRVSKEEFLSFYKDHILSTHDGEEHHGHHGFHDTAKYMFALFDTDKSGEITIGEFKSLLDAFNVGFTVDEIGELVNELDEQNNGTIGEEEFVELLEKHEHLFKKMETPQLF